MQKELTPSQIGDNKMETVVFSMEKGNLQVSKDTMYLNDEDGNVVACNNALFTNAYQLPTSLIRTDEVIAEEWANRYIEPNVKLRQVGKGSFLAGRKSVKGEFHLTREELEDVINKARVTANSDFGNYRKGDYSYTYHSIISSLQPSPYPHTITVQKDGEKYIWETLKAEY